MSIEEVLKGPIDDDSIEIHEPGGVYKDRAFMIPGVPRFEDGQRYLLFLTNADGVWRVWNLILGKFNFATDVLGHDLLMRDVRDVLILNAMDRGIAM